MATSAFANRLATIAGQQHAKFQFMNEADPALCKQIKAWTEAIGSTFASCTKVPWSAVFVSWCVKQAGATAAEFTFSMAHSVFVHQAIKNADNGTGVFRGREIGAYAPKVGDIIHHNRGKKTVTFAFARKNAQYQSHSIIVIEVGQDTAGRFAFCVGGNEGDSVRRTVVRLDAKGLIKPRTGNPFISVIETLK